MNCPRCGHDIYLPKMGGLVCEECSYLVTYGEWEEWENEAYSNNGK